MDFQRLFYINHEFENQTFDWVRGWVFFLFGEFDFVRLKFSSIGFDLLCRVYHDRDTFDFGQGHVNKNKPMAVPV